MVAGLFSRLADDHFSIILWVGNNTVKGKKKNKKIYIPKAYKQ